MDAVVFKAMRDQLGKFNEKTSVIMFVSQKHLIKLGRTQVEIDKLWGSTDPKADITIVARRGKIKRMRVNE